ncbi:MAG TPA: hypothetical protein VH482_31520 [Thermomicrobiales bacterium]|jgi:hypothetical protein
MSDPDASPKQLLLLVVIFVSLVTGFALNVNDDIAILAPAAR